MKKKHRHKSDVWKLAYADFVTALMCLFILLWLLNSTPSGELKKVGEYIDAILTHGGLINAKEMRHGGDSTKNKENLNGKSDAISLLKAKISQAIALSAQDSKNITYHETTAGLVININASKYHPVFVKNGATILQNDQVAEVAHVISTTLNKVKISCYNNPLDTKELSSDALWSLSIDRANAARRMLIEYGMNASSIESIRGFGSNIFLENDAAVKEDNKIDEINYLQALNTKENNGAETYKAIEILVSP